MATTGVLGAAALGLWFLVAPLQPTRRRYLRCEVPPVRQAEVALYETIRDLDHDFETGKLS